jgi:alpha-glucosidase
MRRRPPMLIILALLLVAGLAGQTRKPETDAEGHQWWQHAVFYEIYPRSFADSNGDGTGDLNGITSHLDHLKTLGVDAIWITPCFPSPQVDFGYDVSDYESIDPRYGTLADFDRLVSEGRRRGIRIVLDFVMNHTSDRHQWFIDSASSRTSPKRDWFVWRDGKGLNVPPNNWTSTFGHSAWKFAPATNQWYYHYFYPEQPDLNWRNPAVEQAMFDVTRFWYRRGAAGFRLDAVDTIFEDPSLPDNPTTGSLNKFGDPDQTPLHNTKLPEVHDVLKRLRTVADQSDAVLIGETWTRDIDELRQYYGEHGEELHMPMDFLFARVDRLSPAEFRRQIAGVDAAGWPVYVLSNHDIPRSYVRYGDGSHNDAIAKLMAALYLTLRGTAVMYYGEEIGMTNNDPTTREQVKDPIGVIGWPIEKGRDGERTPMQWSGSANAGFSAARPWLPVPDSYTTHNVAGEERDASSILRVYQRLLALRHRNAALRDGRYIALNEGDVNVLSYLRAYKGSGVLVALNMSAAPQTVTFDLAPHGFGSTSADTLLSVPGPSASKADLRTIALAPFGVYIGEVHGPR